jgi:TPR repeat protein
MYSTGTGLERNAAKSHGYWLQCASGRPTKSPNIRSSEVTAAEENLITVCMQIVAKNFELGRGVLRDDVQALGWYRRCAKRGDDDCIAWMNDHGVR